MWKYIKAFHEKLKGSSVEELDEKESKDTPYSLCYHWLIEIMQYGAVATIVINIILGWLGYWNIGLIFAIGLLRWLWLDIVRETSNSIKGKW